MKNAIFLTSLVLATLTGCGRPYAPATPDGFIDLSERYENNDNHEYRAATADGVVLRIHAYDNEPKADLPLGVRVLENSMRDGRGYALLSKKEVTVRDGTKAMTLEFGHDEPNGSHLYIITLVITDDRVFVLEAGGKKELVEKARASIDWSIKNFVPG
jgi:hypothetical protein